MTPCKEVAERPALTLVEGYLISMDRWVRVSKMDQQQFLIGTTDEAGGGGHFHGIHRQCIANIAANSSPCIL